MTIIPNAATTAINTEVLYDDGFSSVKYHLL